jgi:hypothetical protein
MTNKVNQKENPRQSLSPIGKPFPSISRRV